MQRDQNGLVEAVALGKKKKKSPKQRTTYPHKRGSFKTQILLAG